MKCFGIIEITDGEYELIEKKTRGQLKNENWSQELKKCLHAPNFGRICLSGSRTNFANLARHLLLSEILAVRQLTMAKSTNQLPFKSTAVKLQFTSLRVASLFHGYFRTWHVHRMDYWEKMGSLKSNVPILRGTARNSSISSYTVPYLVEDSQGIYQLDCTHEYYYQVQDLLLCSGRQFCDFVVWTQFCSL